MARVQVPQLKRMDPVEGPSPGRIDVNVPDGTRAFKQVTDGLAEVGKEVSEYYDQIEKQTAEVKKNEAELDYDSWFNGKIEGYIDPVSGQKVQGLRYLKGDPTEAYAKFDEEAKKQLDSYVSNDHNYSDRVKNYIKSNLASKHSSLYNKRLAIYGAQFDTHDQSTTDDTVKLQMNAAVDALAFFDPSKPETVEPFENALERIKELRISRGARIGTARTNEKGELEINNSLKYELVKDLSEATYGAIDNLIAAKQVDSAKYMFDNYDDYLDPVRKEKLTEALDKVTVETEAYKALGNLEDKSYPEQKKILKGVKDIRVKEKALELLDANERRKDNIQMRDSKEIYNVLSDQVQKRMDSGEPYVTMVELESDPTYSRLIGRVTDPKQRKALREMIDNPKESDPEVMAAFLDRIANGELYGMSGNDLLQEVSGLSKEDRSWARNAWKQQNVDTEGQVRSRTSSIMSQFNRKYDATYPTRPGKKASKKALEKKNTMASKLVKAIDNMPKNVSPAESEQFIDEIIAAQVKKDAEEKSGGFFNKLFSGSFFGSDDPKDEPDEPLPSLKRTKKGVAAPKEKPAAGAPAAKKVKKDLSKMSEKDQAQAFNSFKKAKGREPKDMKEMQSWLEAQ